MEGEAHHLATTAVELSTAWLFAIPLLPLLGASCIALTSLPFGPAHHKAGSSRAKFDWASGWIATLFSMAAFAVTVSCFTKILEPGVALNFLAWSWFRVDDLHIDMALRMDHLSGIMTMVVTGVGTLIHMYAIGYMEHDKSQPRFFCYLNLFLFAMLLLVLGDNLLLMFVGWEGVGLCSYLLIGFWFSEMVNAKAGQKAFVVNRIGDAGFVLGVFTLFIATGSVSFAGIQQAIGHVPVGLCEAAAFLLFIGAMGKSAQIPLYVWLPDAMAGPTPVSALIHAATMVTAGVYMITRMSFLYVLAPTTLAIICTVGVLTAFVAATIAIAQTDIKKVLAYSTVSQLGFMFMALGAGAFSNGIFHVVTHAFFKASLFMAAGSVIVGCHHEQDMRKFGGLWKLMPLTFATYIVGTFAIAGFPGLSGFYSKDAILWAVFSSNLHLLGYDISRPLWLLGAITAFLTAFYMTRSLYLTFFGSYRGGDAHHAHHGHDDHAHADDKHDEHHGHGGLPHESPWVMTVPLMPLMVLSAGFGYFYGHDLVHFLSSWTRGDLLVSHEELAKQEGYLQLEQLSIIIAIAGMTAAGLIYGVAPRFPAMAARRLSLIYSALLNKWWVDELYERIIVRPLRVFATVAFLLVDRALIDGSVNGVGAVVEVGQDVLKRAHTGRVSAYAGMMFFGCIALTAFYLLLN